MKTRFTFCILLLVAASCEDFLDVRPKDQIVSNAVFDNDATAVATIRGIYSQMMSSTNFASGGVNSITALSGRSSDEFTNVNANLSLIEFSTNSLLSTNSNLKSGLWTDPYRFIYGANLIIDNVSASNALSDAVKAQLTGEALFVRAFCHFYLTNMFGDVPIVTSTNYKSNSLLNRAPTAEVMSAVIDDLITAQSLLSETYVTTERVRPNRATATALLARAYLYVGDWEKAEIESTKVIDNTSLYSLRTDLNTVFRKNSTEAIFQLMPSLVGNNTNDALMFILIAAPGSSTQVVLNNALVNSFETGDRRRTSWVGTFTSGSNTWYFPHKYKIRNVTAVDEYSMVLRLAEQFLIRAEARAQQNKMTASIADVDAIRQRAGLSLIQTTNPGIGQADLLLAIERERRVELFSEWGHRWFDLKRTGRLTAVLGARPEWQATDALYPIPFSELSNNPNLVQNAGY